jgi:hypothetical protein
MATKKFTALKVEGSIIESTVSNQKAFALYSKIVDSYHKAQSEIVKANEKPFTSIENFFSDVEHYDLNVEIFKKGYSFEDSTYITPIGTAKIEKVNDLNTEATLSHSTEMYKFTITH